MFPQSIATADNNRSGSRGGVDAGIDTIDVLKWKKVPHIGLSLSSCFTLPLCGKHANMQ